MTYYILDGYNIIKSGPDWLMAAGNLQKKREFLLGLLVEFLKNSKGAVKITVVFDGPESVPFFSSSPTVSVSGGVRMVFSEGKTADDRIEDLVLEDRSPGNIILVTNDKGIRRRVGGTGARVMAVDEFARKLFPGNRSKDAGGGSVQDVSRDEKIDEEFRDIWLKRK